MGSNQTERYIRNTDHVNGGMYVCKPTDDYQINMSDLTCLYQINVQARSLGKQFLTNARKYVPNEKKRGRERG